MESRRPDRPAHPGPGPRAFEAEADTRPGGAGAPSRAVVLFRSDAVSFGQWTCRASDPHFERAGPIESGHMIVFPRSSVLIRQDGRSPVVADSSSVVLHNRGHHYTRELVDEDGDRADWFSFSDSMVRRVRADLDLPNDIGSEPPFSVGRLPCPDATFLAQRRLVLAALHDADASVETVERIATSLLRSVLRRSSRVGRPGGDRGRARERALVRSVQRFLNQHYEERLTLETLADHVSASQFRICRLFRRHTGQSVHGYLTSLRLRSSLDALENQTPDLSGLAHQLGYSSHSHYSHAFRQTFGRTPSAYRAEAGRARGLLTT